MKGPLKRIVGRYVLLLMAMATLAACGDSGNSTSTSPSTATLKLATSGTPSANMAGIAITLILPDGVTPSLKSDGSVAESVVVVSGVATPGTVLAPIFTPANGVIKGTLSFALASSLEAGFGAGEYATVKLSAQAGADLIPTDFVLTEFEPIDVGGQEATGLTAVVAEVVVQ